MTVWLAFVLGGIATYLLRSSFIVFMGERRLPGEVERALRYVGPAAFAAIAVPRIVGGDAEAWAPDERILAAVVGGLVCWRFKSVIGGIFAGMATLWIAQGVLG